MKIDMFLVWLGLFLIGFCFQNYFTTRKSDYDISYSYTNKAMDYIAYGQTLVSGPSSGVYWSTLQGYLEEELPKENGEPVKVVILGTDKREYYRIFQPFWKKTKI